jgi:hypothetical protein
VVNGDFSGTPTQSGTVPGWTGSATYTTTATASYVSGSSSLVSTPFVLDYPSNGNLAWFRIGYLMVDPSLPLTVSFGGTQVFASSGSDPANTRLGRH